MSATIEITEDNGEYTAIDPETGARGVGKTRGMALVSLGVQLDTEEGDQDDVDLKAELEALSERTQQRFEEEGVTEEDVEDAIAWARSQ